MLWTFTHKKQLKTKVNKSYFYTRTIATVANTNKATKTKDLVSVLTSSSNEMLYSQISQLRDPNRQMQFLMCDVSNWGITYHIFPCISQKNFGPLKVVGRLICWSANLPSTVAITVYAC